jgi:hypothetical protein
MKKLAGYAGVTIGLLALGTLLFAAGRRATANEFTATIPMTYVANGESVTISHSTGFDSMWVRSVFVQSGCTAYGFALYPTDGFEPGTELRMVRGQRFNYYDRNPSLIRDGDHTGMIHVKFWAETASGCSGTIIIKGVGR